MDRFNGFSQDEINRVTTATDKKITSGGKQPKMETNKMVGQRGQHQGIRRMPDKWSVENNNNNNNNNMKTTKQQQLQSGKPLSGNKKITSTRPNTAQIESKSYTPTPNINVNSSENSTLNSEESLNRSMSKSIEEALFYQPLKILAMNGQTQQLQQQKQENQERHNSEEGGEEEMHVDIELSEEDSNLEPDSTESSTGYSTGKQCSSLPLDSPFKGLSLKEFEVHRRMIEEQNKQKKQLLCKAIELHSQKTAAETRKIEEIKIELAKLDNELAADVAILRKQIDTACIHFSNIEKNYMKIEAQFLKAKMELHQAAEKKELLTEHLCTVIAHNEDRKAEKLSELMQKVGISPTGELRNVES